MDINLLRTHLDNMHDTLNIPQRRLYEETEEQPIEDVEVDKESLILEFFEKYFNHELIEHSNVDTAIVELNITRDAVNDYFMQGINEEIQFDENITMGFINEYFGENLNETTSTKDVDRAIEELNYVCDTVNEFLDIDEGFWSGVGKGTALAATGYLAYKNRDKIKDGIKWAGKQIGNRINKNNSPTSDTPRPTSDTPRPRKNVENLAKKAKDVKVVPGMDRIKKK